MTFAADRWPCAGTSATIARKARVCSGVYPVAVGVRSPTARFLAFGIPDGLRGQPVLAGEVHRPQLPSIDLLLPFEAFWCFWRHITVKVFLGGSTIQSRVLCSQ